MPGSMVKTMPPALAKAHEQLTAPQAVEKKGKRARKAAQQ
jgi:hypothetical protein